MGGGGGVWMAYVTVSYRVIGWEIKQSHGLKQGTSWDGARLNKIKLNYLLRDFTHQEFHNVRCVLKTDGHQPRFGFPRGVNTQWEVSSWCHYHGQQRRLKRCLRPQTHRKREERMPSKTSRDRIPGLCQVSWSFWPFAIHSPPRGQAHSCLIRGPGGGWMEVGRSWGCRVRQTRGTGSALPLPPCVTLGKLHNLSEPLFLCLGPELRISTLTIVRKEWCKSPQTFKIGTH